MVTHLLNISPWYNESHGLSLCYSRVDLDLSYIGFNHKVTLESLSWVNIKTTIKRTGCGLAGLNQSNRFSFGHFKKPGGYPCFCNGLRCGYLTGKGAARNMR